MHPSGAFTGGFSYMETLNYIKEVQPKYMGPRIKAPRQSSPEQVVSFLQKLLTNENKEHFIALYLDGSNQVISYSVVTIGIANQSLVHPREVFQGAILTGACSLIVAHNHPSGNLKPSREDDSVTTRLKEAGVLLGIKLLDHIIFTSSSTAFYSYNEKGKLLL